MSYTLRPLTDPDVPAVVDLSLTAWPPVFASLRQVFGAEIFDRLHPD